MKIILMLLIIAGPLFPQSDLDSNDVIDISVELNTEKTQIVEKIENEQTINSIIMNKSIEWKQEYTLAIKHKNAKIYYIHFDNFKSLKDFLKTKKLRQDSDIEILKMVSKKIKISESQTYSDLRIIEYKRK